jgi:hypothetical protein
MNRIRSKGNPMKKYILEAAVMIGASTLLFQGFTQAAAAAEYNKTTTIPTAYESYVVQAAASSSNSLPEGYKKANYKIGDIDLDFYRKQAPTTKDMAKEDAAEIGAQALWNVYGLSLEGAIVEMGYQPASDSIPRTGWYADVLIDGKRSYCFEVDSVTGDLFNVGYSRTLAKKVSLGYDATLAKNPKEYEKLAQEAAKKYKVISGKVTSSEYNCQGYSNNDPTISVNIKGENGEVACIDFSRYDKAILSISYPVAYQYTLKTLEKIEQEMKEKDAKRKKTTPAVDNTKPSSLSLIEDKE